MPLRNTWKTRRWQAPGNAQQSQRHPPVLRIQSLRGGKPIQSTGVIAAPKISKGKDLTRYMLMEMKLRASTAGGLPFTLK